MGWGGGGWGLLPDADAQQSLAAPVMAGDERDLTHTLSLAAVHQQFDWLLNVRFKKIFQVFIILVLEKKNSCHLNFLKNLSKKIKV